MPIYMVETPLFIKFCAKLLLISCDFAVEKLLKSKKSLAFTRDFVVDIQN
jgi:hypothetical protein